MDEPIVRAELAESPVTAVLTEGKKPLLQFSLAFFLLWMAGTGVALVRDAWRINMPTLFGVMVLPVERESLKVYALVSRLLVAPLFGFSIAYGTMAIWRGMKQGESRSSQPGHWLLYQFAAWLLASAIVNRAAAALLPSLDRGTTEGFESIEALRAWTEVVPFVICGFVSACACLRLHGPRRWRVYFGTHAALAALVLLVATAPMLPLLDQSAGRATNLLLLVFVMECGLVLVNRISCVVSVFADVSHRGFDRGHWAGVGTLCLYVGLVFADSVATSLALYLE